MTIQTLEFHTPFAPQKRAHHVLIQIIQPKNFDTWVKDQNKNIAATLSQKEFSGKSGQCHFTFDIDGNLQSILAGTDNTPTFTDGSKIHDAIKSALSKNTLDNISFELTAPSLDSDELERLHIGWGWASYSFTLYKHADYIKDIKNAALFLSSDINANIVQTMVESVCLVRDLVNIPANDMGPDELQAATEFLATAHGQKAKTIKDKDLLKKNFPMIYDVGKGSSRRPRLMDFSWGDKKHPKITLVGKGVCFDTGGYDIKPSQYMLTMKKDMGGAAHVLGLAHMIMRLNLPVFLRVLIPTAENSISGDAYRPSDILQSRKGITVEIGNTDAEGRLILADALTYACEDKPELLIDFATLTGAARVALGADLPALFSNTEKTAQHIQSLSQSDAVNDPVWNLPLWKPYRKEIDSPIADINSTGGKAGATTAALFLNEFVKEEIEWLHVDTYAWEDNGRPGRPKGGADLGLRSIYAFLQERYGK